MKNQEKLLREYVKTIIAEEFGGDGGGMDFGMGMGMGGGMGQGFGDASHLKRIWDAFADPFKVLSSELQQLGVEAKSMLSVFFESIMTTIVPFLDSEYEEIFKKRDERIKAIEQKHGDVYKRVFDSFNQKDLVLFSFMKNPGLFLAANAFWKSPKVIGPAIQFLGLGDFAKQTTGALTRAAGDAAKFVTGGSSSIAKSYRRFEESVDRLVEDNEKKKSLKNYKQTIQAFRNSDEIKEALKSEKVQQLGSLADEILKQNINDVLQKVKEVSTKVQSPEMIKKFLGDDAKKLLAKVEEEDPAAAKKIVAELADSLSKVVKRRFAEKLKLEIIDAKKNGMPDGTDVEKLYANLINKLLV